MKPKHQTTLICVNVILQLKSGTLVDVFSLAAAAIAVVVVRGLHLMVSEWLRRTDSQHAHLALHHCSKSMRFQSRGIGLVSPAIMQMRRRPRNKTKKQGRDP